MKHNIAKILLIIAGFLTASILFAQTDSRYDAGLNLPFNEKAGDVNPQTGNLSIGSGDLSLPGRAGMNFSFGRSWSLNRSNVFTMYRDTENGHNRLNSETIEKYNNLGIGWGTGMPYIFKDYSSGEMVMNLVAGGSVFHVDRDGIKTYNPTESNLLGYDLLDMRLYEDASISYGDFAGYDLADLQNDYSVTDAVTDRNEYILIMKDNSKMFFREDGKIMMQQDKTGLNRVWYFYNADGNLRLVVDTIARKIRFNYDANGNLSQIDWDVTVGKKDPGTGARTYETETRSVRYEYESAENYPEVAALTSLVVDYEEPYVLTGFIDAEGYMTKYEYKAGTAMFTYDKLRSHSRNVYMLLENIISVYTGGDGKYKAKRTFEYEVPEKGMYTKFFYGGYMEYYKVSGEYNTNRHGRIMNDTAYIYHADKEAGNMGQYTTLIVQGNVTTTYTYSLNTAGNKFQVLDTLKVETKDGFFQVTDFVYNNDRAKVLEEVFRKGDFIYRQKYRYDRKGNLKRVTDKVGLVVVTEYDDKYSIPVRQVKILNEGKAGEEQHETETVINTLGQVVEQIVYLEQADGSKSALTAAVITYDVYGNPVTQTDAHGNTAYTVYDTTHNAYPVKIYQDVSIASWSGGGTVHDNWESDPDGTEKVRIRSWKVFNSDGSVWIEIDNEGYAIEHYYDKNGIEVETINPDINDLTAFAQPIAVDSEGNPVGSDFDNFQDSSSYAAFLTSRQDNPGARMTIDYQNEFVKTYADIDVSRNHVKVNGVQKDGLGNVEEEIEYGESEAIEGVKRMFYDDLGRMIALTDPDAPAAFKPLKVHGQIVERTDKTWIVKYDDLGRKLKVLYPDTVPGKTHMKRIIYNDKENSATTIDPEGRKVYERQDWNGNVVEVIAYGDGYTKEVGVQTYSYGYDQLKRKTSFTDPRGIVTTYDYDERNLLLEQNYGAVPGSDFMTYNDLGQLVTKSDRKGQIVAFTYDEMGRNTAVNHYLSQTDYLNGIIDRTVATEYDNRGNAVRISNENLIEHYIYDFGNRVILLERYIKDNDVRSRTDELLSLAYGNNTCDWLGENWLTDNSGAWTPGVFTGMQLTVNGNTANITGNSVDTIMFEEGTIVDTGAGIAYEVINAADGIYSFSYSYNDAGMVESMTYPDGAVHEFSYDRYLGRLSQMKENTNDWVSSLEYNNSGVVTRMNYANGTHQEWEFDNRKRISHIKVTGPSEVIEDLKYTLNGSGDILSINDNEYKYDGFDRITGAKTRLPGQVDPVKLVMKHFGTRDTGDPIGGTSYNAEADLDDDGRINGNDHLIASFMEDDLIYDVESFEYDKNGNRTKLVQNGDVYTYDYGERNRLERILRKQEGDLYPEVYVEYEYDANGNTVKRTIYKESLTEVIDFYYDTMNRLIKTVKGSEITGYFYDNAGNRFIKKLPNGDMTLYLRHGQIAVAMDVEMTAVQTEEKGEINRYVLSGDLVAGRVAKTVKVDGSVAVSRSWYHLDHLNSTKSITDSTGTVEVSYTYRAFGEQLKRLDANGDDTDDKAKYSYGGKELDDGTELYYFNARYYDATIGRFINVDPVQDGTNWYTYCSNNPLSFVDPTGLSPYWNLKNGWYGSFSGKGKTNDHNINFENNNTGEKSEFQVIHKKYNFSVNNNKAWPNVNAKGSVSISKVIDESTNEISYNLTVKWDTKKTTFFVVKTLTEEMKDNYISISAGSSDEIEKFLENSSFSKDEKKFVQGFVDQVVNVEQRRKLKADLNAMVTFGADILDAPFGFIASSVLTPTISAVEDNPYDRNAYAENIFHVTELARGEVPNSEN